MKRILWVVALLAAVGAGAWWYAGKPLPPRLASLVERTAPAVQQAEAARPPGGGPGGGAGKRQAETGPVHVAVAPAKRQDVPVYVSGLGVVTALRSATVKPQVDGPLLEILFKEGQPVSQGDILARIDPRPFEAALRKAEADAAQNKAALVLARQSAERQRVLGARDIASRETIETAESKVAQSEAALASSIATADTARLNLDHTTIRAPWDGLAGMRVVDEGNMIRTSDSGGLVVLTQIDPIGVVFTLPADSLPPAARNPAAGKRPVSLLDRDRKTEVAAGELIAVDNLIDQNTNAIKLKASFANPALALWPGQFVTARMVVDTLRAVVTVPAAAVQRSADGAFVYIVKAGAKGSVAEQRPVAVDLVQNDLAVLGSGVEDGDTVVTDGQYRLKNGSEVVPDDGAKRDAATLAARPSTP
jgi:membrane fusion protein, multidrug efflux system